MGKLGVQFKVEHLASPKSLTLKKNNRYLLPKCCIANGTITKTKTCPITCIPPNGTKQSPRPINPSIYSQLFLATMARKFQLKLFHQTLQQATHMQIHVSVPTYGRQEESVESSSTKNCLQVLSHLASPS